MADRAAHDAAGGLQRALALWRSQAQRCGPRRLLEPGRAGQGTDDAEAAAFDSAPGIGFNTDAVAAGIVPLPGKRTGNGSVLSLDPAENNTYRALNLAWQSGGAVQFAPAVLEGGKVTAPARYLISNVPEATQTKWVETLALRAQATNATGQAVAAPRIAVYHPYSPSMDEGWCRWVLDQYGFKYSEVTNANVLAGNLRERFDVLLLADERMRTLQEGFTEGTVPPQYAGGLGDAGAREIETFVREGGTLVCLNHSSDYAIEALHLPVRNVTNGLQRRDFFMAGSVLAVEVDSAHPVLAGMPAQAKVFGDSSPVFTTSAGFEGSVLAKYQKAGSPLLSGYLLGEKYVQGYAAALDVRYGSGHAVLLGFRPQWRGQPFGTFRVLFNALLYSGEVAAKSKGTPVFWSPPAATERPAAERPAPRNSGQ